MIKEILAQISETDGGYGDLGVIPTVANPKIKKDKEEADETKSKFKLKKNEAKMTDEEVKSACNSLVKNGDEKAKKFAQGMLDYEKKNGSFHPNQVSGLQNIMKNASFQMAKKEDYVDEAKGNRDTHDKKIAKKVAKARGKVHCGDSQSPHRVGNGTPVKFVCKKKDKEKARKVSKRMKKFNKTAKGKKSGKIRLATKKFRK